jgi:hypothetical protein
MTDRLQLNSRQRRLASLPCALQQQHLLLLQPVTTMTQTLTMPLSLSTLQVISTAAAHIETLQ